MTFNDDVMLFVVCRVFLSKNEKEYSILIIIICHIRSQKISIEPRTNGQTMDLTPSNRINHQRPCFYFLFGILAMLGAIFSETRLPGGGADSYVTQYFNYIYFAFWIVPKQKPSQNDVQKRHLQSLSTSTKLYC
jgi:hypothetical protein